VLFSCLWLLFLSCSHNKILLEEKSADNWCIFRGDVALTGSTHLALPDNPTLLWSFKSDIYTKSSPVVYQQVAYWSSRRGNIFGVDLEGKRVFHFAMETATDATPMIYDSVLYIGRMDGYMCALSLNKQEILWSFETYGQILASPNHIHLEGNEAVIFGSYDNQVYGLNSKDGKLLNRFESGFYINGAVAKSGNFIVYGGCDGWVRIVDCISGVQTDSLDVEIYIPASPAIQNNQCYIADHAGNLYEINIIEGKIVSYKKIMESKDDNSTFVSVPAVSDKMVYVVSDDHYVYALNRKDGSVVWKYLLKGDTGESSPVVCKDKLLVCTKSGIVTILHAKTGAFIWEYDIGEQIVACPAVIKGYFYILSQKGTLFCFGKN